MRVKTQLIPLLALTLSLGSCMQSPEGEKVTSTEASSIDIPEGATRINVTLNESNIEWIGTKPTGTHFGSLSIKEGVLYLKDGDLAGGVFTMDMNSIKVEDIEDPKTNKQLVDHLKSPDFFLTDSFPTSKFEFSKVTAFKSDTVEFEKVQPTHRIEGNLTMRGITRKVNFPARIEISNGDIMAQTPQFIINRTEWDVNYGSKSVFTNLKDNFIHDEIALRINLTTE
ncbi:MAG: YceI family protein [Bacteroidales bacterium]